MILLKKLVSNPWTWIILLFIGAFLYGLKTGEIRIEHKILKQQNETLKEVVVKRDKIHHKYDAIKSDTAAELERLLSYRALDTQADKTDLRGRQSESEPDVESGQH